MKNALVKLFVIALCIGSMGFAAFPEKADSLSAIKLSSMLVDEATTGWADFKACFDASNDSGKIKLAAAAETALSKLVKKYGMTDETVVGKCIAALEAASLNVTTNQKGTKYYVNYTATSVQVPQKGTTSKGSIK